MRRTATRAIARLERESEVKLRLYYLPELGRRVPAYHAVPGSASRGSFLSIDGGTTASRVGILTDVSRRV